MAHLPFQGLSAGCPPDQATVTWQFGPEASPAITETMSVTSEQSRKRPQHRIIDVGIAGRYILGAVKVRGQCQEIVRSGSGTGDVVESVIARAAGDEGLRAIHV